MGTVSMNLTHFLIFSTLLSSGCLATTFYSLLSLVHSLDPLRVGTTKLPKVIIGHVRLCYGSLKMTETSKTRKTLAMTV